jgi:DNA-binding LacI/PurR family transcriptional regulator
MNQLLTGMHAAAREAEVALVITMGSTRTWMTGAAARGTAGVIRVLFPFEEEELAWLRAHEVPFAEVSSRRVVRTGVPHIEASHELAGMQATRALLEAGHRRILYAGGRGTPTDEQRRAGYLRAMREAGFEDQVLLTEDWSIYGSSRQTQDTLRVHRPTAIVAWADQVALAIINEAHRLGLRVPEDLSVVGFDDLPESATSFPRLTTVHVPVQEMGAAAFRAVSQDGGVASLPSVLDTHLVRRESVGPPRGDDLKFAPQG